MNLKQVVQQILVRIIRWRGCRLHPFKLKLKRADGMTRLVCVWHGHPQDPMILVTAWGWQCVSDPIRDCGLNGSFQGKKVFVVAYGAKVVELYETSALLCHANLARMRIYDCTRASLRALPNNMRSARS